MAKNLIPIIAEKLGVEIGEEFKLKYNRNGNDYIVKNCEKEKIYRFTETELEEQDYYNNDMWNGATFGLDNIVYGIYEIVKLPFKPQKDERYYTFAGSWEITDTLWRNRPCDYGRKAINCVFRTQKEALKARPVKYKELTGKEWGNESN